MQRTLIKEVPAKVGEMVTIKGWIHRRRNLGKMVFLDIRDRSGILQVVLHPKELGDAGMETAKELRPEFCIGITGIVKARDAKNVNADVATGSVELGAKEIVVYSKSETPPFEIENEDRQANEELRLKYRYLDLRHERMQKNIRLRDNVIFFIRQWMRAKDFVEIETPILMRGTPEGAREYLVPSRIYHGQFYVLPQSPQQFKQLLMVAGFERYFQIARCFRDEDQRGDRQPEFTQFDFEMSFVEREDVLALTEELMIALVKAVAPEKKISVAPFPRLTYAEAQEKYKSDKPDLRKDKNDPHELAFAWIVDFPMFEKDKEGNIQAMHHPFCDVHPDDVALLDSDPMKVRANSYDLVLNGYEISSGSIRIHQRDLQKKIFDILQIPEAEQQSRFGHMLEAFTYGPPPHGGFAPGIDRLVMLLAGEPNIREVMAFPKTSDARDLMMHAPSEVDRKQLDELGIKVSI
ncbi:aspartate--tRNA ligase [Candidatus Uhrbacteria bacterium]|nr:aspartate--tRNA ligase [Candidatus Uhrbacteria bacterium]